MGNKIYVTPENDPRDYVGYDIFGYPFNKKYPPNKEKYGQSFEGYPYKALGVLLILKTHFVKTDGLSWV